MLLQTKVPIQKQTHNLIDYNSKLLLLGSCFSEHIGHKLSYYKFQTSQNPFGILFHPKAIEKLIANAVQQEKYNSEDIFYRNERWHCFDAHSDLSNRDQQGLIDHLNKALVLTHKKLKTASHIIITLGTAWVYKHQESNILAANCHKVPQKEFTKMILSIPKIEESLHHIGALIASINKKATLIFTVSPVRHIKDGFIENQQSKSHLISAIHKFNNQSALASNPKSQETLQPEASKLNVKYFPAYEIMMDELRDYRFYQEDMIHPNKIAVNYIWNKFSASWFTNEAIKTMGQVEEIQKRLHHKPFDPNSEAHSKFLEQLTQKKEMLIKTFPHISF